MLPIPERDEEDFEDTKWSFFFFFFLVVGGGVLLSPSPIKLTDKM
jgi:hypothetical protein